MLKKILDKIGGFLWPCLVVVLLCTLVKLTFTKKEIYFFVNGLHFPFGDWFFPRMTQLGSSTFATVVTLLLVLLVSYRSAFLLGTAYLFTAAVNFPLKYIFHSARPYLYFHDLHSHIYFVPGVDVLANYYSFPSGHTVCAFTGAVVAAYLSKRKAWGVFYLLLAMLVGYSRMYMSEHFYEDVFAGSVIGTVLTIVWLRISQRFSFLEKRSWKKCLVLDIFHTEEQR
ncbi:MAG: phosphatase PAP2 family protein [Chitinophagaceae bacterium]